MNKKKLRISDLRRDKCDNCGAWKANSASNMGYLCGKCYLKRKHEMRKEKGLK